MPAIRNCHRNFDVKANSKPLGVLHVRLEITTSIERTTL